MRDVIKDVLMERDSMEENDAINLIEEAREHLNSCLAEDDLESAMEICEEFFGLEEDYLLDLIDFY